jgi:hypothetical protein
VPVFTVQYLYSKFNFIDFFYFNQEEEKRLKNEGRETLEETVQKLISKAGSHMESTLIGTATHLSFH